MDIDFATFTGYQRYKLIASLIVPWPIARVATLGPTGVVDAAPFSMFNMRRGAADRSTQVRR